MLCGSDARPGHGNSPGTGGATDGRYRDNDFWQHVQWRQPLKPPPSSSSCTQPSAMHHEGDPHPHTHPPTYPITFSMRIPSGHVVQG